MRALCAQTVLRFPTPDATSYEDSLARARDFIQRWRGHPLIVPAPAPHAPYTCTPEILRACAELAVEFDVPLHIHLSETAQEVDDSRRLQRHAGRAVGQEARPVRREGAGRALRARGRWRDPRAEERQRGRRAQPDEQPQAGRRRRAGGAHAGARRQRRHRHRRRRLEQRPRHVRGDAAGGAARRRARAAIRRRFRRAPRWPWRRGSARARCTWIT